MPLRKAQVPSVALNVVLAFNMGRDTEGILASPIGQPMATVSSHHPFGIENFRITRTRSSLIASERELH